ncbi:MAG: hypothetical protein ACAI35_22095 [Candidatus Methylacidiphilales bacterium]|nr:hypothetical protein [Candidatus Methylacidiphilales bacterium]
MKNTLSMSPLSALVLRIMVCAVPLSLMMDLGAMYALDWFNHLWAIEYFGAYFQQHSEAPVVVNTTAVAGITNYLFYANFFHTFTGILSIWIGSSVVVRLLALITLLVQFFCVERAIREVSSHSGYAFVIATMVTWATYPLTNLYARSAITEFYAVAFLFCSVASLLVLLCRLRTGVKSYCDAVATGFFFLLVTLTHPLTGVYGGVCIAMIAAVGILYVRSAWLLIVLALNALMGVLCLASWLYVLKLFNRYLPINDKMFMAKDLFWESINYGWPVFADLFSLIPRDRASTYMGVYKETSYLETQAMVPLLVLCAGLAWIWWRQGRPAKGAELCLYLLPVAVLIFIASAVLIVFPFLSSVLWRVVHPMQYSYRLVTYVNLGIFLLSFVLLGLVRSSPQSPPKYGVSPLFMPVVIAVACTISVCSLYVKLQHSDAIADLFYVNKTNIKNWIPRVVPPEEWKAGVFKLGDHIEDLPFTFYGQSSFIVTYGTSKEPLTPMKSEFALFRPPSPAVPGSFGTTAPLQIELSEPTLVMTNVCPFPWNIIRVDGADRDVSTLTVRRYDFDPRTPQRHALVYALTLPPGKHTLEYRNEPDPVYKQLSWMSWIATWGWAGLYVITLGAAASSGALAAYLRTPLPLPFATDSDPDGNIPNDGVPIG